MYNDCPLCKEKLNKVYLGVISCYNAHYSAHFLDNGNLWFDVFRIGNMRIFRDINGTKFRSLYNNDILFEFNQILSVEQIQKLIILL